MIRSMLGMDFIGTIQKWSDKLRAIIVDNYSNPILWVSILAFGILLFKVLYSTLNRD